MSSARTFCRYLRTVPCVGRPSAAKALSVGWEKTERGTCADDISEKPLLEAKACRSRAYSPIAIAGRGEVSVAVLMMPKGRLAREKWEPCGMGSQDFAVMFAVMFAAGSLFVS